ncbi:PAC2 family protein [Micropruina sonneratiae]|uniref:PAC2 family protein n=1 Tax=Micropruina sonneratiae TaxID=2986940 RepID=UPI00222706BC|nr:PAC2 family protein [Micropruina sp. KQZ13P-5]MCW3157707.1 PAC2 family protein [Micropruina sp. KQZ13P-5]
MAEVKSLKNLRRPAVVAAFGGWNDAGDAASGVIDHLAALTSAKLAFAIDPDDYYDFQVNRPTMATTSGGERTLQWPTTEVLVAPLADRDLVLIGGPEPNFHWRGFSSALVSAMRTVKPEIVVLLGAMLTDSPHSRPVPVHGSAATQEVATSLSLELSSYEGPTGILGVLASDCAVVGLPTASLWASVPHYVAEPPNPKASLALLDRLEDLLDTPLDPGDLPEKAQDWETQVNDLAAEDSDISAYITALEERRDENQPEPQGDAIAAEIQRYLRRRNQPPGHASR